MQVTATDGCEGAAPAPAPPPEDFSSDEDSSEEEHIPLGKIKQTMAQAWVDKHKESKLDKSEQDYRDRVVALMAAGSGDRRSLRSRKGMGKEDSAFFTGTKLDVEEVGKAARLYYRKARGIKEKRPTKILAHDDFGKQGRHYQLLWHDVGYADQDITEWHPADYARTFEGLVEDYKKVFHPDFM